MERQKEGILNTAASDREWATVEPFHSGDMGQWENWCL